MPLWSHVALQRKASPSGPRNLKGEAGTGVAPRESLWERMDALREREKGKRKKKKIMKNVLSVIWLSFCEGGASQNFTDHNSALN